MITKNIKVFVAVILVALCATSAFPFGGNDEPKEFTVDGIKVIFKPSTKEIISVRLFIKGGTANYPKSQEGIEVLALNVATGGGTTKLSKSQLAAALDKIGTEISSSATYDYAEVNMNCIKTYWDNSWKLFTEAILTPAFDEKEFALFKEKQIASTKQNEANPDSRLRTLAMKNAFQGKNYSKIPEGTPESLATITLEQVRNHYKTLISKKNCFLVIVGNIGEDDLKNKIKAAFGTLPEGKAVVKEERNLITAGENIEDRDIATNYIRGLMSAPGMDDKDGVPMRVAMEIIHDRFWIELRSKRSLSYAPSAFYAASIIKNPYNIFYISTQDPKQSLQVMIGEINTIKEKGFTEKELVDKKLNFLTDHYLKLETNSSQSLELGMAELSGSWKLDTAFAAKVNQVTLDDINRVFNKYCTFINWTYLGKKDAVSKEDFKQPQKLPEKEIIKNK